MDQIDLIPLELEYKQKWVQAISDALYEISVEFVPAPSVNQDDIPWKRRSRVINKLLEKVPDERMTGFQIRRQNVHIPVFYDKKTGYFYLITTESTFSRKKSEQGVSYLALCAEVNTIQMTLFDLTEEDIQSTSTGFLNEIASKVPGDLQKFVLVLYDFADEHLLSVRSCLIDINLMVINEDEHWDKPTEVRYPIGSVHPTPPDGGKRPLIRLRESIPNNVKVSLKQQDKLDDSE